MAIRKNDSRQFSTDKQLNELALLYQFSNTLLSTIRLNKLSHLILTALTSGKHPFFERAMLFLRNEKSGVLQGMLGVSTQESDGLTIVGGQDSPLSSRWDISDEVIARQRTTEVCRLVRGTRVEIEDRCLMIKRIVSEQQLVYVDDSNCGVCRDCDFIDQLGLKNFAAVPLMARDYLLGIILVDNPFSGATIDTGDLHFLRLFAGQAGMAIQNSVLYNRVEDAHDSLRDARERLIHGARLAAIGEMAANLAHELKNPLITIGGFAGRLLKRLPGDSQEHQYALTISKEVSHLEKMLADILTFAGKPTICYNYCDVRTILNHCFTSCAATLEDQGVRLDVSLEPEPLELLGDEYQLKQVFLNLIINACDSMPSGGVIRVSAEKQTLDKSFVMVSISDTGGGIPETMLSQIFSPFFTTKRHGTGLGLAIVNRILLNHNGSIEAANHETGAVFTVTLPLAERPAD